MIQTLIFSIIGWVQSMGWLGVFLGSVLEEIIPPIPSTLTQLTYGAVLFSGADFSVGLLVRAVIIVGIPAAFGVLTGSLPFYLVSFYLGRPFIDRFGKWLGVSWSAIESLEKKFHKNHWDDIVFTGLRATPILPSIVLAVGAGVLRLPLKTYVIGTLLGTFIRAAIMGCIGAVIGTQLGTLAETVDRLGVIGSGVLALTVTGVLFGYWTNKKKKSNNRIS